MKKNILTIRDADWIIDNSTIKKIRTAVFIDEQHIPVELEWDNEDATAQHCIAMINSLPVATARLQTDGQLGRMAVLQDFRNQGIGSLILKHLINRHQDQLDSPLFIHAQKHAIEFYKKFNFVTDGNEFMEAGIPHYLMTMKNNNKK